jgi:luciferase-like monooxygenase
MELGVFIPIGNNGWLISTTSPQYKPSFDLNREVVEKAERFGFDFALSMIKLHGFGGPSQFWDYNLESFTLMAGLAPVTSRIRLFATCAVLTMPPPIAPRRWQNGSITNRVPISRRWLGATLRRKTIRARILTRSRTGAGPSASRSCRPIRVCSSAPTPRSRGMEQFGTRILPLMRCRKGIRRAA